MNNFFLISKVRLNQKFKISVLKHEKSRSKKLKAVFGWVLELILLLAAGLLIYSVSRALAARGYADALPLISYVIGSGISLILTILKINEMVSGENDVDFLLSLPVSNIIQIAMIYIRIYLESTIFVLLFAVPMGIAYAGAVQATFLFWLRWLLGVALTALPVNGIATLAGIFIALVLSTLRRRNLVQSILSLSVIAVILTLFLHITYLVLGIMNSDISGAAATQEIINVICKNYVFGRLYEFSIVQGIMGYIFLYILISCIWYVFSTFFLNIAYQDFMLAFKAPVEYKNYTLGTLKQKNVKRALFSREVSLWLNSKSLMMRSLVGAEIAVIIACWFLIRGDDLFAVLGVESYRTTVEWLIPLAVCVCMVLCSLSFAFASLDGKSGWILQSAPIGDKQMRFAKVKVILCITVPVSVVTAVIFGIALHLNFQIMVYYMLLPILASLLAAFCVGRQMKI